MGYGFAVSPCFACKKLFTFHPSFVPSYKDKPVCKTCMEIVNKKRIAEGTEPHPIHPKAYKVFEESELEE